MTSFRLGGEMLRFCVVGGVGFVIDAGGMLALTWLNWADPVSGRTVSFSLAVCATFLLNRLWTFGSSRRALMSQAVRYLGVQGIGFLTNFIVYIALYRLAPAPFNAPLVAIVVASAIALVVNFTGSKLAVFPVDLRDAEPF